MTSTPEVEEKAAYGTASGVISAHFTSEGRCERCRAKRNQKVVEIGAAQETKGNRPLVYEFEFV